MKSALRIGILFVTLIGCSTAWGQTGTGTMVEGFASLISASSTSTNRIISYRGDKCTGYQASVGASAKSVVWQTAPVPTPLPSKVTFVFTGALGRYAGQMEILLGSKSLMTITIPDKLAADYEWVNGNYRFYFDLNYIRNGDQGVFYLTVPGTEVVAGQPATLTVKTVPNSGSRLCWFMLENYTDTLAYRSCELLISSKAVYWNQANPLTIYVQPLLDYVSSTTQTVSLKLYSASGTLLRTGSLTFSGSAEKATTISTSGLGDGAYRLNAVVTQGTTQIGSKSEWITFLGDRYAAEATRITDHERTQHTRMDGVLGDYDRELRTADNLVDNAGMISHLNAVHANMYDFLVWHEPTDWDDLQAFLPMAQEQGIKVLVTLVAPSYNPTSSPYGSDYIAWAQAIARLSLDYPNLVAWVIDDFHASNGQFTGDYIAQVAAASHAINPDLGFYPVIYAGTVRAEPEWMDEFGASVDGIMYVLSWDPPLQSDFDAELNDARFFIGPNKVLLTNVYGMATNGHPDQPTPEYLRQALQTARAKSNGIRIYCLPKTQTDPLFLAAQDLYGQWLPSSPRVYGPPGIPHFSPDGGVYAVPQSVTLRCVTANAVIHYTTNGADPTLSDPVATQPVMVGSNMTLKARAWRTGWVSPGAVSSADYTIDAGTPTFTPDGGVYGSAQNVVVRCTTPGATIHYTTNGREPTEQDSVIASGASLPVDHSLMLKARAWSAGNAPSEIKSAIYELPRFQTTGGFVKAGKWNLISLPADPTNPDPLVIFSGIDIAVSNFQFWKSSQEGGGFQSYGQFFGWTGPAVRGVPYLFFEAGAGSDKDIGYAGSYPHADFEMTFPARSTAPYWVMIGTPFPSAVMADDIRFKNVSRRGDVWLGWMDAYSGADESLRIVDSSAQGWDARLNRFYTVAPSASIGEHQFDAWYGYWLLVMDPGELKIRFPRPL